MNNYYFTFGQCHVTKAGLQMKDRWVRVTANNHSIARSIFIEKFTSVNMESPDKFAFQYADDNFKSEYYPKGELLCLKQE